MTSRRNIYDNWERLVVAVVRREEIWQLCHQHSRSPSICSIASDSSSSWSSTSPPHENDSQFPGDDHVWEKQYKPGVYVTLAALTDGTRFVKRVRFSRAGFEEHEALIWWFKNKEKVYRKYSAWGRDTRIRRSSLVNFCWSPLADQDGENFNLESEAMLDNPITCSSYEHHPVKLLDSDTTEKKGKFSQAEEHRESDDVSETEKTILTELKYLVQEALNRHEFGTSSSLKEEAKEFERTENETNAPQEVFIWGVKLMEDDKTDTVLLKFLQAQDYNVKGAFGMINDTIQWRKEFGIDELVEEDLNIGNEFERATFMHGCSKEGHPVCYNAYTELINDQQLYQKYFSDEEQRQKFLKWRIQFFEKIVRKLDFSPGGISTIFQVFDLKYSPGKREFLQSSRQALQLLSDNYPEFVAKQVFINSPWWSSAYFKMISPFITTRTKSKFEIASPSLSTATLFKYISAEHIPKQYGGISKDGDFGTATDDRVTEIMVKPSAMDIQEFSVTQAGIVRWEVRVVGWELSYSVEYVEDEHKAIIVENGRINGSTEEQVISNSFKVYQPGKLVVTIAKPISGK